MINPMDLTGKHILITGGSSGIGRATAVLASQLGARVTLIARREVELKKVLEQLSGDRHQLYTFDLTQISEIELLIKKIVENEGAIDGFVHCAGIAGNRPLALNKPEFMQRMMNIHFFAFNELLRCVTKRNHINENASLIGISSVASLKGDRAQGAYAATKTAINGSIHAYAKELAVKNIRVNSVAFGMINTEMYQGFQQSGGENDTLINQYLGIGELIDAANGLCFLLSDAAKFITGTTMVIDGGYLS